MNTRERTVATIGDGVYVIRHPDAPGGFPQGNTTVIVGGREVLVVDSCYLPSSAREDIVQIRRWTEKPVRYLLNTHWHFDHTLGNRAYADAFPGIAIIAHAETVKLMDGYNPDYFLRVVRTIGRLKETLASGKNTDGSLLTEARRTEIANELRGREVAQAEFGSLADRRPNVSFDRELTVDLGDREVQIKNLGRGNTSGDAVAFLPKEKILVTGDVLDHPVPYAFGGYPTEMIATLRRVSDMDPQILVPGHGDVIHGKAYLERVVHLFQTVVAAVEKEVYYRGPFANLEDVEKAVDLSVLRKEFAGDDKENGEFFDESIGGLVKFAFNEAIAR